MVLGENIFAIFEEKCVFDEKVHFCGFGGKYVFVVLARKIRFAFLAENVFLTKKCVLRV